MVLQSWYSVPGTDKTVKTRSREPDLGSCLILEWFTRDLLTFPVTYLPFPSLLFVLKLRVIHTGVNWGGCRELGTHLRPYTFLLFFETVSTFSRGTETRTQPGMDTPLGLRTVSYRVSRRRLTIVPITGRRGKRVSLLYLWHDLHGCRERWTDTGSVVTRGSFTWFLVGTVSLSLVVPKSFVHVFTPSRPLRPPSIKRENLS